MPQQKVLLNESCCTPKSISTVCHQEGLSPYPRDLLSSLRRHQELYQFSPTAFQRTPKRDTAQIIAAISDNGNNMWSKGNRLVDAGGMIPVQQYLSNNCQQRGVLDQSDTGLSVYSNGTSINEGPKVSNAFSFLPHTTMTSSKTIKTQATTTAAGGAGATTAPAGPEILTANSTRIDAIVEATNSIRNLEQKLKDLSDIYQPARRNKFIQSPAENDRTLHNGLLEESRNTVFITEDRKSVV